MASSGGGRMPATSLNLPLDDALWTTITSGRSRCDVESHERRKKSAIAIRGKHMAELKSQQLRRVNHQGDALRMGMNWTEEDLAKPQILVESAYGMGHPGTFHFRGLEEEVSNGVFEAGGKPGVFNVSDICDGVVQATDGMSYSLISRDIIAAMVEIHALGH